MVKIICIVIFFIGYLNTYSQKNQSIQYQIIDPNKISCFFNKLNKNEIIINSDSTYNIFFPKCKFKDSLKINFSKQTILGYFTGAENYCNMQSSIEVLEDKINMKYKFMVNLSLKGYCKHENQWNWYWIIIPKLPENYQVLFQKNTSRNEKLDVTKIDNKKFTCKLINELSCKKNEEVIFGYITKGPINPLNVDGEKNYLPYRGTISIKKEGSQKIYKTVIADSLGYYQVNLPKGNYSIYPGKDKYSISNPSSCYFQIQSGKLIQVDFHYDTGIR